MATVIRKYMTTAEFFERAHNSTVDESRSFHRFEFYGNSEFNGNQDKVYRKYSEHAVEGYANDMVAMIGDVNLDDCMYERRWEFRSRLDCGDEVDVDRLLDGEEETCWNGLRRALRGRQSVRVFVNFGGHCGRSKSELMIPGAMAVAIAQAFETVGIGTEIFGVSGSCDCDTTDKTIVNIVNLKSVDQYADFGMIGYVCGDDHVFRNSGFINWIQTCIEHKLEPRRGLGFEASMTASNLGLGPEEMATSIIVPHKHTVQAAKEWLGNSFVELLKKFKQ